MDKEMFDAMLPMMTADIVNRIANKKIDEDTALSDFLKSNLFALLADENTKMWHYSGEMMAYLYENELNGTFSFPEV